MSDYAKANRARPHVAASDDVLRVRQAKGDLKSEDDDLAALNESPRLEPLIQMRLALDSSPRVQSQLALQRALNPAAGGSEKTGGGVIEQEITEMDEDVIQAVMHYGDNATFESDAGTVHYHYLYNDADINSMHVTFADHRNYNNRTWASRSTFTPNGYDWQTDDPQGNWSDLATQLGNTPAWAVTLINENLPGARNSAMDAYKADVNIRRLLRAQYPQLVPNAADFPAL